MKPSLSTSHSWEVFSPSSTQSHSGRTWVLWASKILSQHCLVWCQTTNLALAKNTRKLSTASASRSLIVAISQTWIGKKLKFIKEFFSNKTFSCQRSGTSPEGNMLWKRLTEVHWTVDEMHLAQCQVDAGTCQWTRLRGCSHGNSRLYVGTADTMVGSTSIRYAHAHYQNDHT